MSISIKNVSKYYGKQKALDNVSFEIEAGEIIGFLGPNGAGKSTLMKIITAYIPASSGIVIVNGLDVEENDLKVKSQIGYLAEQNPLYYEMYVKEFLLFSAGIYGITNKKERVKEVIEEVGLTIEQNKKIGQLSKGYKQRVGLAQAILHDPSVLILDEPTTGLDPNQLEEIRSLIKELGKKKTVMLSTHIMQEVEAICDRIVIIHQGKIVANDKTKELSKLFHSNRIIIEFANSVNINDLQNIEGVQKAISKDGKNWTILQKKDLDLRSKLFDFAVKQNNSVLTIQMEESKLEDVFKQLTSKTEA
jgi:ABC-2 type transport system ATP-binding protein